MNIIKLLGRNSHFKLKEERFIQKIGLLSIAVSLVIILLILSLIVMYAKHNIKNEMISDGLNLSSMLAGHSVSELQGDNVNKLLEIVSYKGSRSGLIYSTIIDVNQKIIAHWGSSFVDRPTIAKRAFSSNNPLKQIYKDDRTNNTIYEFSRPLYRNGKKEAIVRLGFSPDANPLFSNSEINNILLIATLFFSLVQFSTI